MNVKMKQSKYWIVKGLYILSLMLSSTYAQQAQQQESDSIQVETNSYMALFLSVGKSSLITSESNLAYYYIDESPSQDVFYGTREVKSSESGLSISLGLEGGNYNGGHWEFSGELVLGEAQRLAGALGFGFTGALFNKRVLIRPVAAASFGVSRFDLGEMINEDLFIRVNGTDFYEKPSISVNSSVLQLAIRPRLDIVFVLPFNLGLKASVGYHYKVYEGEPFLRFKGTNEVGEIAKESIDLSSDRLSFIINGNQATKKLPFSFNGIFWSIGVGRFF